jgi:hypothetical protein
MIIAKLTLHKVIESVVPDFMDADLYNSRQEIELGYTEEGLINTIKAQSKNGYLSLDNPQGHEVYYRQTSTRRLEDVKEDA